jgi:hypothetical protein
MTKTLRLAQKIESFNADLLGNLPKFGGVDVLEARAWTVAKLVSNHLLPDKQSAVDALWRFAETNGIVEEIGVDATQRMLAEAFG